ncbi:MAG: phosphatidate cytidylyltransferase [Gammaproteobacteria bacterium]|nr:phosphatidate cytidylyltransferase [Gammaproteobacteria bacterium]
MNASSTGHCRVTPGASGASGARASSWNSTRRPRELARRTSGPDPAANARGATLIPPVDAVASGALRQRVTTAVVLIAAMLAAVLYAPAPIFALVLATVLLLGAWEWSGLAAVPGTTARAAYVALTAALAGAAWPLTAAASSAVLLGAGAWWVLAAVWVGCAQRGVPKVPGSVAALACIGWLVLLPAWLALVRLHAVERQGPFWVILLMVLIWLADSAAYFGGRRFGRRRLADRISPGKTWAGVWAALAMALAVGAGTAAMRGLAPWQAVTFMALCLATVAMSIVGDLLESLVKRHAGVKDSGALLPGHGGVLDRIDSLTAAAPVFLLGLIGLGLIR